MKRMRLAMLAAAVGTVALAQTTLAAGAPPQIQMFQTDETAPIASCDGFDLIRHVVTNIRIATFFGAGGAPSTMQLQFHESNRIFNSVTGKGIDFPGILNITVDLSSGTTTVDGTPIRITVPQLGLIISDHGRLVIDANGNVTFEGGAHPFFYSTNPVDFCALVA